MIFLVCSSLICTIVSIVVSSQAGTFFRFAKYFKRMISILYIQWLRHSSGTQWNCLFAWSSLQCWVSLLYNLLFIDSAIRRGITRTVYSPEALYSCGFVWYVEVWYLLMAPSVGEPIDVFIHQKLPTIVVFVVPSFLSSQELTFCLQNIFKIYL